MPRDTATSLDVARLAGVSQSAVSRVFTPGASVSQHTSDKVREAATKLGYRPNSLARAMVSGRSRIIGLVVAYLDNQFYPDALEKLSARLQGRGYHVLVFLTTRTQGDITNVIEEILDYQVDGIIAASVALSSDLSDRCRMAGVPLVLFNRSQDDAAFSSVTSNNYAGGQKVAELLIAGGYQRIAYIAGWEGASTQRDREAGFTATLSDAGINLYARAVGDFRTDRARQATLSLFSSDEVPDAVFVANDHMAFSVLDTLRYELGLRVPEDVSVIGYDDVLAASWPSYDLTTVRQSADQMVDQTVEILMQQINDGDITARRVQVDGPLVIRGSTRQPDVVKG